MTNAQQANEFQPEKWTKAVLNIEGRKSYLTSKEYIAFIQQWHQKKISNAELERGAQALTLQYGASTGTAIFFTYMGKYYLLTAKHVLEDAGLPSIPGAIAPKVLDKLLIIENGSVTGNPGIGIDKTYIPGLNAGPPWRSSYIFAPDGMDLAILNLDNLDAGRDMPEVLKTMGYVPIELSDIDTKCMLQKGQLIYAVGFAGDFSIIDRKPPSPYEKSIQPDLVSLPVISEGTVGDDHADPKYFTGNIFVHKGSSGGAIVSNNKLVGIVLGMFVTGMVNGHLKRQKVFVKPAVILPLVGD